MSLTRNILANYVSQIYVTLIGIVMVPMYIRYMGTEAYGLVGFFAMLQAWFNLLDVGLTPTMARETARFNGDAAAALSLRRLMRAMEGIFIGIALLGGAVIVAGSDFIAEHWLKAQQLPLIEVQRAVILMAVLIALRWICGLYRGAINGFERMIWLSGFNIAVATARFVLVIPLFIYLGASPSIFFSFQLIVALAEVVILAVKSYSLLPNVGSTIDTPWRWEELRDVLRFSTKMAFISSVWVLVTQSDKLILSNLLPLADYAHYTIAVLVASSVLVISGPISAALLPRMTKLSAEDDEAGLLRVYRNGTQLVGVIAIPAALVLALFAEQVLWAWTGDAEIARKSAPVLTLYALGNGVFTLAAFPYYLQFAKGDVRLHLIGSILFLIILVPTLILLVLNYGAIGAGYAWLGLNTVYFFVWTPLVHNRFDENLHRPWVMHDIFPIVVLVGILNFGFFEIFKSEVERMAISFHLLLLSTISVAGACIGSRWVRDNFLQILSKIFNRC